MTGASMIIDHYSFSIQSIEQSTLRRTKKVLGPKMNRTKRRGLKVVRVQEEKQTEAEDKECIKRRCSKVFHP